MTAKRITSLMRKAQDLYNALDAIEHEAWDDHIFAVGQLLDDLRGELEYCNEFNGSGRRS